MSDEACETQAGTFCPNTDCTDLKQCVEDYHRDALEENKIAFANYLEGMPGGEYLTPAKCDNATDPAESCGEPKVWDPENLDQCGQAREYFGFDANFVNDKQICRDINQLRNTRDFEFLEEFFNQGSDLDPEIIIDDPPLVPLLILTPPVSGKYLYEFGNGKKLGVPIGSCLFRSIYIYCIDATDYITNGVPSNEAAVKNGQAWRATNFALGKVFATVQFTIDTLNAGKCPCVVACPFPDFCGITKSALGIPIEIIKYVLDTVRPPD
jgi:hypothetical protein